MTTIDNLKLCFTIPASPNDNFYSQIAMFRLALNSLGGIYEKADMIITLGHDKKKRGKLPRRWRSHLSKNVVFEWVDPQNFKHSSYSAQVDLRWQIDYSEYDIVIFCDADVMLTKPIEDLLLLTLKSPALTGTITHSHFRPKGGIDPQTAWNDLSKHLIGKRLDFNYRHTLAYNRQPEYTFCPFYINFGFVLFTPGIINQIKDEFVELRPKVADLIANPYFSSQITLTLVAEKLQVPTRAVGLRYNFPNDKVADQYQKNELTDVRVIHYLRTGHFDRQKIFTSKKHFQEFLSLDLDGSDKVFQDAVMSLTNGRYPF